MAFQFSTREILRPKGLCKIIIIRVCSQPSNTILSRILLHQDAKIKTSLQMIINYRAFSLFVILLTLNKGSPQKLFLRKGSRDKFRKMQKQGNQWQYKVHILISKASQKTLIAHPFILMKIFIPRQRYQLKKRSCLKLQESLSSQSSFHLPRRHQRLHLFNLHIRI